VREQAVTVDVGPIAQDVETGLDLLAKAKAIVVSDKGILSGTPCIAGTRIPVHDLADMLSNGDAPAAILTAYPQLSSELLDLAAAYAQAYPRRGRPPLAKHRKSAPKSSRTLRLDDLPPAP